MNKQKELELQVSDRETALRAIGEALVDKRLVPARRIDQAIGILRMYGCEPKAAGEEAQG